MILNRDERSGLPVRRRGLGEWQSRTAERIGNAARLPVLLLISVIVLVAAGCSSESSTFGQYFQGRTLHISVVSIERLPELRYSTIDPNEVIRRWSISPSEPGGELVLVRMKVENHTAVSAFINVDRSAAELRDFSNATYHPLLVAQTVWQDFRGENEALVRMDLGQCFDGARALIDPGTTVRWQSEAKSGQYITFGDSSVPVGTDGMAELAPGQSVTHTFGQTGEFSYDCSNGEGNKWPAEVRVVPGGGQTDVDERSVQFLEGSFELLQGHGLEGYLVFEAPEGTEFRDMRWRTGDSITVRF